MFRLKSRIEVTVCVLSIVMILFIALQPTTLVSANSNQASKTSDGRSALSRSWQQPKLQSSAGWLVCDSVRRQANNIIAGYCDPAHSEGTYIRGVITLNQQSGAVGRYIAFHNTATIPGNKINFRYVLNGVVYSSYSQNKVYGRYQFTNSRSVGNMDDRWNLLGQGKTVPYDVDRAYLERTISGQYLQDFKVSFVFDITYPTSSSTVNGYFEAWIGDYPCDAYSILSTETFEIEPTIETPLGPDGTPPDDQIYETVTGELYKISTAGGPWNDGTTDRGRATAVSWDGTTWKPFSQLTGVCRQNASSIYIKAESDTFHIRVDDTAGNFANNFNNPNPVTYTVAHIPSIFLGSIRNAGQVKSTLIQSTVESDGTISNVACAVQCAGDPINTLTGVFSFTLPDMSFPTSAGDLIFQRSYSSGALENAGVLGYGWTHNHDAKLIFPNDPGGMEDYVLFQSVLGNQYLFKIETDGSFTPGPSVIATLTKSTTTPITYTLTDSQQAIFKFDENGRLILRADAQGHEFDYEYDAEGKLIEVSADNGSRFIQIGYDAEDRIDTVSNHASQQITFAYDALGDLVSATDVLEQTWTYVYDSGHHMTQAKDPAGKATVTTGYDAAGRANLQYDGEGNLIVSITCNSDGNTIISDALANTVEHRYNEQNIAVQTTDPVDQTETRTFDANFRPTMITNDAEQTLEMIWSPDGVNLLSKTDPAGNETNYTYDSLNNLTSVIDARDNTTTYTYDGKLLTSSEDALGGDTTYTYTPEDYLESVTDTAGRVTSYEYDSFGQRISMTDPNDNTWEYTYDSLGRLIDTTDPRGRITHNEYNAAGKLVRVTQNYDLSHIQNYQNLYNIVTEYEYDVRGNQIAVTDTYDRTTQYVYDDADRLLQTIDPVGNTTTNTYDAAGRLISTTDPLQNTTTYEYDATGRLIKTINPLGIHSGITAFNVSENTSTVTDILGRATVFHYDELGRVVEVVDPLDNSTTTTYDDNGNVVARTDQLGRVTEYEYDALNRLIRTTDPNGGVTETVYDAAGDRIATIDPLDHQTTYEYDAVGRLIATIDPLNRVTQTEYDIYGRRAATIDAAGHRTTYTYDLLDRVITVTGQAGNTTHTDYDALGNVLSRTDANGNTTTTTYDVLNRPLVTTDANGNETTNAYDAGGNLISVTDALENTTSYTYDVLNRRITVTDPLEHTTYISYDSLGNLLETTDANDVVTRYEYDALNRQVAVILNYRSGVQPDAETNVRYEFEYNEVGNRVSVTDPNGNVTTYGYDALNRVISKSDPLDNTWSYTYDLSGNRISATDAKDQTIGYTYDDAGQLIEIDYPSTEPDVTFTYNLTGQRIGMIDRLGNTTWTYDNLNRTISVTDAFNKTIGYEYDAVGNRTELTYPDGKIVTYTYDDANQLINVEDWDNQNTGYSYDATGRLLSITRANGVSSEYAYDNAGRLIELQHAIGTNTLASYSYSYDPAGNRTRSIEDLVHQGTVPTETPTATATQTETFTETPADTPTAAVTDTLIPTDTPTETAVPIDTLLATATDTPVETETITPTASATETMTPMATDTPTETPTETPSALPTLTFTPAFTDTPILPTSTLPPIPTGPLTIDYTYDALNRLTSATYDDGRNFGYTYDPAGNVLELGQNLGPGTIITTYTYDAANQLNTAQQGSTTWQYTYDANGSVISDGVKTYTYDSANRLIEVNDQSITTSLSYNGLGQRLSMDAGGVIAHYVMDGERPLTAESSGNTTFYLYGPSAGSGWGGIGEKTTEWNFSLPDGTNTPRQLTDVQGEITLSARYTPWGDTLDSFGTGNFTYGYLGGVLDAATGLLYVGNGQYYDPSTGRFLTRDVYPNSPNPYVPWNPIGAMFGPLAVVSLFYTRKKKGSKTGTFLVLLLVLGGVGMTLAACGPAPTVPAGSANTAPPVMPVQTQTPVTYDPGTVPATPTGTPPAPIETPTPTPCPTPSVTPGLELFGITFEGGWSPDQQAIVLAAVSAVGGRFSVKLGGMANAAAFAQVYGTPFIFYKAGSGDVCEGGQRTVVCYAQAIITERLLVHELAHALQHSRYADDTRGPYASLENAQIVDDLGRWVTGKHDNGVFERSSLGYISEEQPDMYHGPRINGKGFTDWNSNQDHRARNEDFADMFMNWVYNSFDYSPEANGAGIKRYEWIENHMLGWITG